MYNATQPGTSRQPLTRDGGLCYVRGCNTRARVVRVSTTGVVVSYCSGHEKIAALLFDRDQSWKDADA